MNTFHRIFIWCLIAGFSAIPGSTSTGAAEMPPKAQPRPRKGKDTAKNPEPQPEQEKTLVNGKFEEYPGQIDRWAGKPKCTCKSCNQSIGSIDKHSPPDKPKFLHWVQSRTLKKPPGYQGKPRKFKEDELVVPSGEECYACYNDRRKRHPGKSQKELIQLRKEDPQVDELCNEHRHDTVGEVFKYKGTAKQSGKNITTTEKGENSSTAASLQAPSSPSKNSLCPAESNSIA